MNRMSTLTMERPRSARGNRPYDAGDASHEAGYLFGSDGDSEGLVLGGGVLLEAEVVNDVVESPLAKAVEYYERRQTADAIDAFAHPLIEQLSSENYGNVDAWLSSLTSHIFEQAYRRGNNFLSRDFHELELWLAAVTLTSRAKDRLSSRDALVALLRKTIEASDHVDRDGLLKAIY
jgi:hypothetical protein